MKMNLESLKQVDQWKSKDIKLPQFNIKTVKEQTRQTPKWVHFGAGNIFRGFLGQINQELLNKNVVDTGIIACDTFYYDIIEKIYNDYENLTLLVHLEADGTMRKEIIASIVEAYAIENDNCEAMYNLINIFENTSLQMVSFTITEKGYQSKVMEVVTQLLYYRYKKGKLPIALVSMDNCRHNGEILRNSVLKVANQWIDSKKIEVEFLEYLLDASKVAFPWSMIDKITPRPAQVVMEELKKLGVDNMEPIVTKCGTYIAPYVNTESPQYLVIEDTFPNGRPKLEQAGVYLTDRETVNKVETMKVTTCLNPLHTALAVYGCLLGYDKIYKEMKDKDLKQLVEKIGYQEGMKVVVDPIIINPMDFIDEVINRRFSNPFVPDEPQRIITDTSQKVGIRYGQTIKSYIENKDLDVKSLIYIPLVIAGWLRYLLAVDDEGNKIELSADPLLDKLKSQLKNVEIGSHYEHEILQILDDRNIFGVSLVEIGLSQKIEDMFISMIKGPGAVRNTLKRYLS